MNIRIISQALMATLLALFAGSTLAAVTAEEAARLKTELTPLGAERAGNKEGTIPAWTGTPIPYKDYKPGGRRPDPFAADKLLYSVTSKNMEQYAGRLTEGTKAMLKKYPDSFRVDVYPTRRSGAAPQWVYDNTLKNATRAKLNNDTPEGAFGGTPFPIPKSGAEVMSNHTLRWRGEAWNAKIRAYLTTAAGQRVLIGESTIDQQMPYYYPDNNVEDFNKQKEHLILRLLTSGPALRAGEAIAGRQNLDGDKSQVWVYLPGQRRVRKLPNACCDAPTPPTAGQMTFDETFVFDGRLDHFDWKLVGKKEMLVPYNTNALLSAEKDEDVMGKSHLNPDRVRWELHRVWVVEARLRAGQRHVTPKATYYVDEDTWHSVLADRWDAKGQLWKTMWQMTFAAPDLPGITTETFGYNDMLSGAWFVQGLMTGQKDQYRLQPRLKDNTFTADAMAGEGVR